MSFMLIVGASVRWVARSFVDSNLRQGHRPLYTVSARYRGPGYYPRPMNSLDSFVVGGEAKSNGFIACLY